MASIPSWSDLPLELLGLVVAHLPHPADRARCRSWHSAVRRHGHQLPWIVDGDCCFCTLSDGRWHRMPSVPDGTICVGTSDDWLVYGFFHMADTEDGEAQYCAIDSYVLHNGFSGTSIPLPELDFLVREDKGIRKFRVRSTADDFVVAFITTSLKHPFLVIRPGKGVWLPERPTGGYRYIIDIAFLGDTLYAITRAQDLVSLYLTSDVDGRPTISMGRRTIRQNDWWPASDDEEDDEEVAGADEDDNVEQEEEEAAGVGDDGDDDDNDDEEENNDDEGQAAAANGEDYNDTWSNINYLNSSHYNTSDDEITHWHLVESLGKLLMVRPRMRILPGYSIISFCPVDVFEADMDTCSWVPIVNGLGGGRALFMGFDFSKSVSAPRGEVEEDAIYFVHSGEVFNMKTQTCNPQQFCERSSWGDFKDLLYPPELVL